MVSLARGCQAMLRPAYRLRLLGQRGYATSYDYDLFCVGAGSGGVRASRMSAGTGAKVAVCEMPYSPIASDHQGGVGGTCVIRGCVPKKFFVFGSEFAEAFRDSVGYGWNLNTSGPTHSWQALVDAKNKEIQRLNGIYHKLLDDAGVDHIEGKGSIVGPHTVSVNGKHYTAKNICIATGGRSSAPKIPGIEHCIDSDHALELPTFPKRICIVGSGYIAVEFAGLFAGLGAEVHLFYRKPLPLNGFDMEVRRFSAEQFAQKGLSLHPETTPARVELQQDGSYIFTANTSSGEEVHLATDCVMFATGRSPNTKGLGLENVNVQMDDHGAIVVDDYSKTSADHIYAIGDVTNRINLTPVALMEGIALTNTLFGGQPTKPDHTNVASAVFSQPQIASVGLTEEVAIAKVAKVDVYSTSFKPMRNNLSGNPGRALMKVVVDAETDVVLGMHMMGPDSAEIMQGFAVAVKMGCTKAQLDATVGIHPSSAEEFVTMRTVTRQIR